MSVPRVVTTRSAGVQVMLERWHGGAVLPASFDAVNLVSCRLLTEPRTWSVVVVVTAVRATGVGWTEALLHVVVSSLGSPAAGIERFGSIELVNLQVGGLDAEPMWRASGIRAL
ncbi:hypothetical protein [Actinokineospora sp. NBRC 105648]|uniref:hypothetical protein n=1 Tax=Actinokineospora sp. NBRC 105648 TaxID=3032206 RepID=UPI0024A48D12|nr:hypothetical protein [Actinokineospora sp. NBRC 105648]GLZ43718.1 hypothetical protein Acsp05_73420 [Actinokineospora sp. NBRC 105648]